MAAFVTATPPNPDVNLSICVVQNRISVALEAMKRIVEQIAGSGTTEYLTDSLATIRPLMLPHTDQFFVRNMIVMYSPDSNPTSTVIITNLDDGWKSAMGLFARLHQRRQVLVISSGRDSLYPRHMMQLWEHGAEVRFVRSMRDSDRWQFDQIGIVQPYEQLHRYRRRRIADRVDRGLLIEYLVAEGIDVVSPDFWQSNRDAHLLGLIWRRST